MKPGLPGTWARQLARLLICLLVCGTAHALDRDLVIGQFHHTSWTAKDGAPIGIRTIEQTTDGWIWLGGPGGLYRFDGIRFELFRPLPGEEFASSGVSRIEAGPDGELWIGLMSGGISVLKAGHLTHYGTQDGLDTVGPTMIRAALDGAVWATSGSALFRFEGKRWERVGADWNLHLKLFKGMAVDGRGTLWVTHSEGVAFLRKGSRRFEDALPPEQNEALGAQVIDGVVWKVSEKALQRLPDVGAGALTAVTALTPLSASRYRRHQSSALIDRDLNLWTVYCPAGLCRTRLPQNLLGDVVELPRVEETFKSSDGLSGDAGMMVLEDQEGSIWVATNTGLDRFRRSNLTPVALPRNAASFSVVAAPGKSAWVTGYRPQAPRMWAIDRNTVDIDGPDEWMRASHGNAQGRMWFAGSEGFWEWSGSKFISLTKPAEAAHQVVRAMASDSQGLWVAFANGVFRLQEGLWSSAPRWGLPSGAASSLAVDDANTAWFGFGDGTILSLAAGKVRTYDSRQGIDVGAITFLQAGKVLFAAGEGGVDVLLDGRFHRLKALDPQALAGVSGIVQTAEGDLWLNGRKGAVHISAAEMSRFFTDPRHTTQHELFDIQDGYPGIANLRYPQPSVIAGADGRLWFAGVTGVAWLDPRRIRRGAKPAAVAVVGMIAAGTNYPLVNGVELPPGTTSVQFQYTALGLAIPERARFRYRLDGVDTDWREPDARRETGYTNLSPGAYRFRVIAASEDGRWSENGESLAFAIRPTSLQSAWFKSFCALALFLTVWLLYRLRVRQLTTYAREKAQERLIERERIARELHDTLLQSTQGLILRFQAVANRIGDEDPNREMLEQALDRADEVLTEARERVRDLRQAKDSGLNLVEMLRNAGEELTADSSVVFHLKAEGEERSLPTSLGHEIYRIAREAIINALRHARAESIDVSVFFSKTNLRLLILDDGIGIDAETVRTGARSGHWGLSGMRERAERIGASLQIRRRLERGTELELSVALTSPTPNQLQP